jgi:hypothetical protein
MNPQQEQDTPSQPSEPTLVETPLNAPTQEESKKSHKKLGLVLLIGPSALLVLTFALYAISNLITNSAAPSSGELFAQPSPISSVINILLFLLGTVGVITWLPGIIIGIILLNKK